MADKAVNMLHADIPLTGGPVRVEWKEPVRGGGEVTRVIHTRLDEFARMLARTPETQGEERLEEWFDLLGTRAGMATRRHGTHLYVALSIPAMERTIFSKKQAGGGEGNANFEELTVPMPPLLWVIKYNNAKMTGACLFVAAGRVLSLKQDLLVTSFPWGNANPGSGVVCWGNVSIETLTPEDPWLVDELFFKSKLNDHLWHASMGWDSGNRHWKDWLANHPGQPAEVSFQRGQTVWSAVRHAVGGGY